jgi:tRNA (adenine37-N6)-methyltransferase
VAAGHDRVTHAQFTLDPIGFVHGGRADAVDDDWARVESTIVLDAARFVPDVIAGLDAFSHIDVVFVFHLVDEAAINLGARHPRNNTEWPKVGIFAQRAKARPNRIGVTTCELVGVDADGLEIHVRGLDAIDGTPVLDIKPYVAEFAPRTTVRQPAWATELMSGYWNRDPAT